MACCLLVMVTFAKNLVGGHMAELSIPISETTLARLRELARWEGSSITEALDQAVNEQYDRKFGTPRTPAM
jgi:hypothetical protein